MLLKSADDRKSDIETLEALFQHPNANATTRKKIKQQIAALRIGVQGEKSAAYEINFHFGSSENWLIIHDFRIKIRGRVAQIDHLLINRFLEIWICESKCYGGGISISEYGECTSFRNGRAFGIASPLEQNEKHRLVLEDFFKKYKNILPSKWGGVIYPKLFSMVLISNNSRISRPSKGKEKYANVFKADQIKTRILEEYSKQNVWLSVVRFIRADAFREFGENLVKFHRPHTTDWHARFGLKQGVDSAVRPLDISAQKQQAIGKCVKHEADKYETKNIEQAAVNTVSIASELHCGDCNAEITMGIVRYCRGNAERFSGKLLCMSCQKNYSHSPLKKK